MREIEKEDIPYLLMVGEGFWKQTNYYKMGLPYSKEKTEALVVHCIDNGIALIDGGGFILMMIEELPFSRSLAAIEIAFYVDPSDREFGVGTALVEEAIYQAKGTGAEVFTMVNLESISPEISEGLYKNLGLEKSETTFTLAIQVYILRESLSGDSYGRCYFRNRYCSWCAFHRERSIDSMKAGKDQKKDLKKAQKKEKQVADAEATEGMEKQRRKQAGGFASTLGSPNQNYQEKIMSGLEDTFGENPDPAARPALKNKKLEIRRLETDIAASGDPDGKKQAKIDQLKAELAAEQGG